LFYLCSVLFSLLCLFSNSSATNLNSNNGSNPPDIYERITTLADSLKKWAKTPSAEIVDEESGEVDIEIEKYFPRCKSETNTQSGVVDIELPRFMGVLTTGLSYNFKSPPHWSVQVNLIGNDLTVDSLPIPITGEISLDPALIDLISNRLIHLRTISLPQKLRPASFLSDTQPVNVLLRGRDIVDISFAAKKLNFALHRLSADLQVYAGLLDLKADLNRIEINYYILITYPGFPGHHFLEWREEVNKTADSWETVNIDVILTPYIRTDNLQNLFAHPDKRQEHPIRIQSR